MKIELEKYAKQRAEWPQTGRHIMAQYDDQKVVVYQAYKPSIGHYAVTNGVFGGEFSYSRMSWVKPNFLWMMFRSGWGTKPGQEVVLAISLRRQFFERVLEEAVHSSFAKPAYESQESWKLRLRSSEVRLQWDPDHGPEGEKLERRAIQLGLRGAMLERYGRSEVLAIDDVSDIVRMGRESLGAKDELMTPLERPYLPASEAVRVHLGLAG